jgi:adapter protein MecA 1/2
MKQEEQFECVIKEKAAGKSSKSRMAWVYAFADFEDVLSVVERLPEFTQMQSSLYEYEEEYYLVLCRIGTGKKRLLAKAILDEYGETVDTTKVFLSEHGKVIIPENAVQTLKAAFTIPPQN